MNARIETNALKNKKVIIAPYTKESFVYRNNIAAVGADVIGFLDNYKQNNEIINESPHVVNYDYIIIIPSKHKTEIANKFVDKGFNSDKIFFSPNIHSHHLVKYKKNNLFQKTVKWFLDKLKSFICLLSKKISFKRKYLYFAENFIDVNLLESYKYHYACYKDEAILVIYNCKANQDSYFGCEKIKYVNNKLLLFYYFFFFHCLVIDHKVINSVYHYFSGSKRIIQLWHGLPLKTLDGNIWSDDGIYEAFISPSKWFNENIFKNLYNSKHFLNYGYPRNDIFFANSHMRNKKNNIGIKTIVYMPTYRDSGKNDYPLKYDELNRFCKQNEIDFILKLHPYVLTNFGVKNNSFFSNMIRYKKYSNIYLFPPFKNIYPLLTNTSILITDYSSVYYDFLLKNNPIIFYLFDKEEYQKYRGGKFLVPIDEFTPGIKVNNFYNLLKAIEDALQQDDFKNERKMLTEKIGLNKSPAMPLILNFIRNV